jgi:hypothetical protein
MGFQQGRLITAERGATPAPATPSRPARTPATPQRTQGQSGTTPQRNWGESDTFGGVQGVIEDDPDYACMRSDAEDEEDDEEVSTTMETPTKQRAGTSREFLISPSNSISSTRTDRTEQTVSAASKAVDAFRKKGKSKEKNLGGEVFGGIAEAMKAAAAMDQVIFEATKEDSRMKLGLDERRVQLEERKFQAEQERATMHAEAQAYKTKMEARTSAYKMFITAGMQHADAAKAACIDDPM